MDAAAQRLRKRFRELDTHDDVLRCLKGTVRELRRLKVKDQFLDPIRINKAKALVTALKTLAELIATSGIQQIPDEALIAEVVRRRDARLGHTPLHVPEQ